MDAGLDREALPLLRDTLARVSALYGDRDLRTAVVKRNLASALRGLSLHREAERLLGEAIESHFSQTQGDTQDLLHLLIERAESLVALRETRTAGTLLLVAEAVRTRLEDRAGAPLESERGRIEQLRARAGGGAAGGAGGAATGLSPAYPSPRPR